MDYMNYYIKQSLRLGPYTLNFITHYAYLLDSYHADCS